MFDYFKVFNLKQRISQFLPAFLPSVYIVRKFLLMSNVTLP